MIFSSYVKWMSALIAFNPLRCHKFSLYRCDKNLHSTDREKRVTARQRDSKETSKRIWNPFKCWWMFIVKAKVSFNNFMWCYFSKNAFGWKILIATGRKLCCCSMAAEYINKWATISIYRCSGNIIHSIQSSVYIFLVIVSVHCIHYWKLELSTYKKSQSPLPIGYTVYTYANILHSRKRNGEFNVFFLSLFFALKTRSQARISFILLKRYHKNRLW